MKIAGVHRSITRSGHPGVRRWVSSLLSVGLVGAGVVVAAPITAPTAAAAVVSATSAQDVYIADYSNNRVVMLPANGGQQVDAIPATAGLYSPTALALDNAGTLYIADTSNNRIVKKAATSSTLTPIITGLSSPYGVAVDTTGNIFVANAGAQKVSEYSAAGALIADLATSVNSNGVAVDSANNIYYTNQGANTISKVLAGTTAVNTTYSTTGITTGVAVDSHNNIFYSTRNASGQTFKIVSGTTNSVAVGPTLSSKSGWQVAVDAVGNVFVADASSGQGVVEQPANGGPQFTLGTGLNGSYGVVVRPLPATTVTQTISPSPGSVGSATTITATVAPASGTGTPSGTVTVSDGATTPQTCSITLNSGTGSCQITETSRATYQVTSTYTGDTTFGGSATTTPLVINASAQDVYISDQGNNRVVMLPANGGQQVDAIPTTAGLNNPFGLALDNAGTLYVADTSNNRIVKKAANSSTLTPIITGLTGPQRVAVDTTGNIFVSDPGTSNGTGKVSEYSAAGALIADLATSVNSYGVAVDSANNIYYTNYNNSTISKVLAGTTAVKTTYSTTGNPLGVAVDSHNNIFYHSASNGQPYEIVSGTANSVPVGPTVSAGYGLQVAVDAAGNVFVADAAAGHTVVEKPTNGAQFTLGTGINGSYGVALGKFASTVTQTITPSTVNAGTAATIAVTVASTTSGAGTPTGSVTVSDGATSPKTCSITLDGSGKGSCQITETTPTTYQVTSTYTGDTTFGVSTATTALKVNSTASAVAITLSPSPATSGQAVTITATVTGNGTPAGTVTVTDQATSNPQTCSITLANGTGTCPITENTPATYQVLASYTSSDINNANSTKTTPLIVNSSSSATTVTINSTSVPVGTPATIGVTVTSTTGTTPTGTVTVSDGVNGGQTCTATLDGTGKGSCSITETTYGTYHLTATYNGDTNNAKSTSATADDNVTQASTVVTQTITPSTVGAGTAATIAVTVASTTSGAGTPTGTVTVTDGASTAKTCSITLDGSGKGSCQITETTPATYTVTSTYAANGNFTGNTTPSSPLTVTTAVSAVAVTITPSPATSGQAVTITATVTGNGTPTGTVTVTDQAATNPKTCTITLTAGTGKGSCPITETTPATYQILSTYNGDTNNATSTTTTSLAVNASTTTTAVTINPTSVGAGQAAVVGVTVTSSGVMPTGSVTVTDGTTGGPSCAATLDGTGKGTCSITETTPNTYTLTATYNGDSNNAKSSNTGTVVVAKAGTLITATVNPTQATPGQAVTVAVRVSSTTGGAGTPTGTITVTDGAAPPQTCTIAALDAAGNGSCVITEATAGTYTLTATYGGDTTFTGNSTTVSDTVVSPPAPPAPAVPGSPEGVQVTGGDGQVTVSFTAPTSSGGAPITGYVIAPSPACSACTGLNTTGGGSTVKGLTNGVSYTFTVTATNSGGTGPASAASAPVTPAPAPALFTSTSPSRVLDTRTGVGAPRGPLGTAATMLLTVQNMPVGTTGVVLNVTTTGLTGATTSYISACPVAQTVLACKATSVLNAVAGVDVANEITVPVASDGKILFYNNAGAVYLAADLTGFVAGGFTAIDPVRTFDTRNGVGVAAGQLGAKATTTMTVPNLPKGATGVIFNLTASGLTGAANTYIWVCPAAQATTACTSTSMLNVVAGVDVANQITVPVDSDGKITMFNNAGSIDLAADVTGFLTTGFTATGPSRVFDTRNGTGVSTGQVGPSGVVTMIVPNLPKGTTGVLLNLTATGLTGAGSSFLSACPAATSIASCVATSMVNVVAGVDVANQIMVPVASDGKITLYNNAGSVDVVADVAGYMS